MVEVKERSAERAEVEHLLASGAFERSPGLAQLLAFVCNKYFDGTAAEVKEYNIAVEALGRSANFDQKKDSIVRVQFHRLRERLREYYESEGADRPIRVEIPQGQYVPQFLHVEAAADLPIPATVVPAASKRKLAYVWLAIGGAILLIAGIWLNGRTRTSGASLGDARVTAPAGSDSVRILVGLEQGTFLDGFGNTWQSDRYFQGGSLVKLPNQRIAGTREPRLYQSRRQGDFRYDIPLAAGVYELRLHFAETHFGEDNPAGFGGEGSRAFRVQVNGQTVIQRLDVVGEAGASTAHVRVFKDVSPAEDGKLHISFVQLVGTPFLNAIEITPGTPGRLRPIRIVAQPRLVTDSSGNVWLPDRIANGGQIVKRTSEASGTTEPDLYGGERFGNLTYSIPVPAGVYGVKLYLSERWIGPEMPGGGGAGSRLFDILCNGVALARNYDIFSRAGGPNRAIVQSYHGIQPTPQGRIVLTLLPVKNFALVNALELVDESRQ
jgi:hypothetical protein